MIIDPNWRTRIVAYRTPAGEWATPEDVAASRGKPAALDPLATANPYTWEMVMRRVADGRDVPGWLVMHVEGEMVLRRAG